MNSLFLNSGPTLIRHKSHPGDGGPDQADVTDAAVEYLFDPVALGPDLTLGDIFRLLHHSEALQRVFRRDFAIELCEEARKSPVSPRRGSDPEEVKGIEYLELYRQWRLDSSDAAYWDTHQLHLHGIGHVLDVDVPDYGVKAGERIQWSVSLTPLRELLALPLRVKGSFEVREDDIDANGFGDLIATARCDEVTLGQVIHGVLWELSFHGTSENKGEVLEGLREQKAEIDAGTAELTSGDDLFDELDTPGYVALFETLGDVPRLELRHAIRGIPDATLAIEHLTQAFGNKVVVNPAFRDLTGRAFRKAFRTARSRIEQLGEIDVTLKKPSAAPDSM